MAEETSKTTADYLIEECCQGNEDALTFLRCLFRFCHAVDDAIDRDNPKFTTHSFILDLHHVFHILTFNPFYRAYGVYLMPLITQAFIAWHDSMTWRHDADYQKRCDADVIKGYYHEVFYYTAYLIGGIDHALNVTRRYRAYDHEAMKEEEDLVKE